MVGLHGVFILSGYTCASWVGVGFYFVNAGGAQWRIPLAIQVLPPLLLACGVLFLPESPRWLIEKGRREEALAVLTKSHHSTSDDSDTFARNEFGQIEKQLDYERTLPSSWVSLFQVKSYRKRAIVGFFTMFCAQCTGTQVINNYGPMLYSKLGYGSRDQLLLQAGWISWGPIGNLINAVLLDIVGRKAIMIFGLASTATALLGEIIMLAIFGGSDNRAGNSAAVFFLFLHIGFYASCLDAATYVYASEIWPTHLRAKGCSLSTSGLFVASLILLIAAPTAFAAISWKYYLVFFSVTFVSIFLFASYFPEAKGLPLEEVAQQFGDHVEVHLLEGRIVVSSEDQNAYAVTDPATEKNSP
ncbi:Sugar transporter family protein [Pleurostoma richardsiae]|uniref:Sugar transporter family protein n=1 Tax=Pleurostoma richardsiae TaxID=41990 RepID=A0AA38S2K0_9PEZI|nr:Sugar transporter family protein [Pleurostoma richardsiae]